MCLYKRLSESPCLCITALLTISNVATHFNVNCVIRFSFMLCVMLVSAVCAWLIYCPILSLTQTQTGHSQKRKLRLMPQCCPNPACAVRASKTDGGFFPLFFLQGLLGGRDDVDMLGFESVWNNIKDKYTSLVKIRLLWFNSGVKSPQCLQLCLVAAQRSTRGDSTGGGDRAGVWQWLRNVPRRWHSRGRRRRWGWGRWWLWGRLQGRWTES